jgi:hypothetical protein
MQEMHQVEGQGEKREVKWRAIEGKITWDKI